jgi:ubiquinone/menaquinone biosynthesis C-methylase UbiE
VKHQRADSSALPFDPDTSEACRSERMFQHLSEPARALSEMTRVTKAGGWTVVLDSVQAFFGSVTQVMAVGRKP